MRRGRLYGLFFLSGVSALIYEVVWQRLLNLVFGVSTLSVSAVLAAFMAGLALGRLFFGRFADRTSRPLRWYAWLEAGVGATGLLVPPCFAALAAVYPSLHKGLEPGGWGGVYLRFVLSFLILGIPCTLMGGTLPLMGRLALGRGERHNTVVAGGMPAAFGLLYAINTFGAALGSALTGLVLLRFLGMQHALWVAAAVNFTVAVGARLGAAREAAGAAPLTTPSSPTHESDTRIGRWVAIGCAGLTGATGMALEVAWTRVLGILTSNSAYCFTLVLTVMLLGLGLGALIQWAWSQWQGNGWHRFAVCQWLLAAVTLGTVPFFRTAPAWLERVCDSSSVLPIFLAELALTATALLVPAVLMGCSWPLLVSGVTNHARRFGSRVGRFSAANTLGCAVGAFLAGFVFIPWLGVHATFGTIIGGAALLGVVAWSVAAADAGANTGTIPFLADRRASHASRRWAVLMPAVVLSLVALIWLPRGQYVKSPVVEPRRLLFYQEGSSATVNVVEESGLRTILVDGQPVAGTTRTSVIDQKMLAHLPLLLHPAPARALTVGFGSGGTSYSMILHGVQVDCVEIEAVVVGAADYFRSENRDILSHPNFHLKIDDARSWLRVAPVDYDVIVTDCTNIQYRSNGDLYTVDYFRLLKDRLTQNGLAAAWVPANGIADQDLRTLLRTFRDVFPHTSIWYMNLRPTDFLIVVGAPAALEIDLERLRQRMSVAAIAQDLSTVGLADPCRLLYTFLAADDDLSSYLEGDTLNTDDRPILSYSTYGATFRTTIGANLVRLLACRGDVARFVRHPAAPETMMRHYAVSNQAILGHIAHFADKEKAALAQYSRAAQLLPEDGTLQELVSAAYWSLNRASRSQSP